MLEQLLPRHPLIALTFTHIRSARETLRAMEQHVVLEPYTSSTNLEMCTVSMDICILKCGEHWHVALCTLHTCIQACSANGTARLLLDYC